MKSGKPNSQINVRRMTAETREGSPVAAAEDRNWRLPSGETLADFAFQSGFLAPSLLRATLAALPAGKHESEDGHMRQTGLLALDRWLRKDYR